MYKALIDNGTTYLFNDNNVSGIESKNVMGFLINTDGILELINSISISEYYINAGKKGYLKITKDKAMLAYSEILKAHHDDNNEMILKKIHK